MKTDVSLLCEMKFGSIPSYMNELIDISLKRSQFTLHDETIKKTRRILTMEQEAMELIEAYRNHFVREYAIR